MLLQPFLCWAAIYIFLLLSISSSQPASQPASQDVAPSRLVKTVRPKNLTICITQMGGRSGFSVLMTDTLPNLHVLDTVQCFPMFLYEEEEAK